MKIDINKYLPQNAIEPLKNQDLQQGGFFKNILGQLFSGKKDLDLAVENNFAPEGKRNLISLGYVNSDTPTVSNLLVRHPDLGKNCWDIVFSQVNQSKPFTKIPDGSEIFIDPDNKEIIWGDMMTSGEYQVVSQKKDKDVEGIFNPHQSETISDKLVDAVEDFIGTGYGEVDCYELVVGGLEKLGVKYRGSGGLSEHLVGIAKGKGLPFNAYMTGEGIVEASGAILYSKVVNKVDNPDNQAKALFSELEQSLEKGAVLSFSTQTRGHTGIVSKKADGWTYINSGRQDHNIEGGIRQKGVGEEFLPQEIHNWFRLAFRNKEALSITVGRFDENKLVMYKDNKQGISVKA